METALSLPFSVDPYGAISSTVDQSKIWSDRIRFVLGTNLNERIMNPLFGTLIPAAFMETVDQATSSIESEVKSAFTTQLSLLTLQSVDVMYDEYSNTMNVTVIYDLPNAQQATTTIELITIDGTDPVTEENL